MSINATLFIQAIVFLILVWFTMKFVWPPIAKALDERAQKIAEGLAAADRANLWQLFGPHSGVDGAAGTVSKEVRALYVIYMPYATPASTGIPSKGAPGMPWLMFPGTPKAHVMLTPTM